MKKNLKKVLAILLAVITICSVFAACSKGKGEGAPTTDEAVNATENSTESTSEEGWSENTTAKKEDESTYKQSNETTQKNEATTKASSSNGSQTTTKKLVTTTKKQETTTKKPVTTTKPSTTKPTTTKPPVTTTKPPQTTKPSSPYLTQAQKNQVINYYRSFPEHGAAPGYYVKEVNVGQVPGGIHSDWTQENFDRYMSFNDYSDAQGAKYFIYAWEDKDGKSILWECLAW